MPQLESLLTDIDFGWRQLRKRKVTTAAAVLSLGLGIGSCVAAFRLVDALFLRSMPVSDPASLYAVTYKRKPTAYLPGFSDGNSYPFFEQRARIVAMNDAEVAAASIVSPVDLTYGSDAETEKAYRQWVSGGLFSMLGIKPALGRLLMEDDDHVLGKSPYAVISYGYWERRFGRDPKAVGRTFRMDDMLYEIVGVGPKGFTGTEPGTVTDVFVPAKMEPSLQAKNLLVFRLFVRVKPGVSIQALGSKLNAAYQHWEDERLQGLPKSLLAMLKPNARLELKRAGGGASNLQMEYGEALTALGILVGMVLLIGCVNVANLMAGQAASRTKEMALRISFGSGRARLVRMVLVESAMLGAMAALLGLGFAWWATPFVVEHINPPDNPARLILEADWRIFAFAGSLAMSVTLICGLLPALRSSNVKPASDLKSGGKPGERTRWMQGLIAAQAAFCCWVLFLAGLFAVTITKLLHRQMGFEAERVLLLDTIAQTAQAPVKWDQMAAALGETPSVQSVALEDWPLLSGSQHNEQISAHGELPSQTLAFFLSVSPGWFDTMRIPMVSGRDFRENDSTPGVAIVNEKFAKEFLGAYNPVGQAFDTPRPDGTRKHYQVVGLVKNAMYRNVREETTPLVYLPLHQAAVTGSSNNALQPIRTATVVVRVKENDTAQIGEALRRRVTAIAPEFRVSSVTTQTELISNQTIRERLLATLGTFFAAIALLLAATGLYGVLHYSVVQREREIGIRLALGAGTGNIIWLVTGRVLLMALSGAAVGLVCGVGSERFVSSLLYGIRGTDVSIMALPGTLLLLATVALAASPAVMRAVQIDPAVTLKSLQ